MGKPEEGRAERNRYVIFVLVLSYTACAVALSVENVIVGWELWAIPFLLFSAAFSWWIHLEQPFTERVRIYTMAGFYYGLSFYQGVHESSLFDISLIMTFVFFLFSLADELRVFDVGLAVYFGTMLYQILVHQGFSVFRDTLTVSRMVIHILIVVLAARFAKSMINGRHRSNEMQGRALAQLAEMNRRTEDFMSNISHELRTPINAVMGLSSLLIERRGEGEGSEELIQIYRAGHRLSEQVGDILDYTEIDTGRVLLQSETYAVYSVLNDVISIFRAEEEGSSLDLVVDVEAEVPSKLSGDVRRLKKILWHLLDNAYKFTKQGGIYLHLSAEKRDYGINLCLEVSDTGRGILPEELHKISRGFYQGDSGRTRSAGGIGLGLAIVYGFVHAMGGFVTIESVPGQGTSVRLSIPQAVSDASPCMSVGEAERYSVVCYLRSEKYTVPMVREYYETMIGHLVRGLRVPIRRAQTLEELKRSVRQVSPTHVFTAREEYEEDPGFFGELSRSAEVIVVADRDFAPPQGSRITVLRKPLYGFPIAGILNSLRGGREEIDPLEAPARVTFPGLRVLVVDDEAMNLVVARGIFSGYGMQVQTADSGRAALELYDRQDFDLIFMDHMMPEMDGVEAMKRLKQIALGRGRDTRFVALTANAVSGAREMFLAEGFDGFLAKPLETVEMEHVLRRILNPAMVRVERQEETERQVRRARSGETLGVERCLGDVALYRRLREIFILEQAHNLRVFRSAYATGTLEPYRVRLRAVRDGSKLLGEEELSRQAMRLEEAMDSGDESRIQREHEELCEMYRACVDRLRQSAEREDAA